jgi:hypothetical protein
VPPLPLGEPTLFFNSFIGFLNRAKLLRGEEGELFASEKFRSIQEAYEAIKKERGFT